METSKPKPHPAPTPLFVTSILPPQINIASLGVKQPEQVPVADYKLTQSLGPLNVEAEREGQSGEFSGKEGGGNGAGTGGQDRSCYSFCMCPGGQVVPTSVDPKEVWPSMR